MSTIAVYNYIFAPTRDLGYRSFSDAPPDRIDYLSKIADQISASRMESDSIRLNIIESNLDQVTLVLSKRSPLPDRYNRRGLRYQHIVFIDGITEAEKFYLTECALDLFRASYRPSPEAKLSELLTLAGGASESEHSGDDSETLFRNCFLSIEIVQKALRSYTDSQEVSAVPIKRTVERADPIKIKQYDGIFIKNWKLAIAFVIMSVIVTLLMAVLLMLARMNQRLTSYSSSLEATNNLIRSISSTEATKDILESSRKTAQQTDKNTKYLLQYSSDLAQLASQVAIISSALLQIQTSQEQATGVLGRVSALLQKSEMATKDVRSDTKESAKLGNLVKPDTAKEMIKPSIASKPEPTKEQAKSAVHTPH